MSIAAFAIEIFASHSRHAAENVNKELKKIKDKAKGKGTFVVDSNSCDNDGAEGSNKKSEPFSITSKNQLLANMLMEYEGALRRWENQTDEQPKKKFTLKRRKADSVRVKTSDNREQYFTYMQ